MRLVHSAQNRSFTSIHESVNEYVYSNMALSEKHYLGMEWRKNVDVKF